MYSHSSRDYDDYLETGVILHNRYKIIKPLGEGSFGKTYIAEDNYKFRKRVVVKQLKINFFSEYDLETAKKLFEREASTLGKLQHPMIPQLEAFFIEEDKNCYLVMEYIEGNTLDKEELIEDSKWEEQKVIELLKNIVEILKIVHREDIVHRDIKPDNLIRRAKDQKISLIDFGSVTKELKLQQEPRESRTTIGNMYAAPEQWTGKAFPSSDIYAVGMIAIQALTGRSPKRLIADPDTGYIVWNEVPASENFKKVIQKMTEQEPSKRYQSVDEVLIALDQMEKPKPISPVEAVETNNLPVKTPQKNTKLNLIRTIITRKIVFGSLSLLVLFGVVIWVLHKFFSHPNEVNPNFFPIPDRTDVVSGTTVKIAGSIAMMPLNRTFKDDFENNFPNTTIDLTAYQDQNKRASNRGIKLLCQEKVDIAASSRSLDKDEKCPDGKKKLFAVRVGMDALSVVVHHDNPVNNLSKSQLKKIFQCQISEWTEIEPTWANKNPEIKVLNRPDSTGGFKYFQELFLDKDDFCPQGSPNYSNFKQLDNDETTLTNRNFTINQISYAAYGLTNFSGIKRLSIDNVKPEDESYPYRRPLFYIYTADSAKNPSLPVKQFLGFVLHRDGKISR
jgi:serine/threonine protein kinase